MSRAELGTVGNDSGSLSESDESDEFGVEIGRWIVPIDSRSESFS